MAAKNSILERPNFCNRTIVIKFNGIYISLLYKNLECLIFVSETLIEFKCK